MDRPTELKPTTPSFGGDVSDFLETIKSSETGEQYVQSMNPNGNPFEGKTVPEAVRYIRSVHGLDVLDILQQGLDSFYDVEAGTDLSKLPEAYSEASRTIRELIEEDKRRKNQ